jgi:hypothetical protein
MITIRDGAILLRSPEDMMNIRWSDVYPVLTSIAVIILVAVVQRQSKVMAAVLATMPINAPLAMWVVYAGSRESQSELTAFNQSLVISVLPTVGFLLAAWLAARAGWKLPAILGIGYLVWGLGLGVVVLLRRWLSV